MVEDRATRIKKQNAYAKSILGNAMIIGGMDEALRVRDDLESVLYAAMGNAELSEVFSSQTEDRHARSKSMIDHKKIITNVFAGASDAVIGTLIAMAENNDLDLCAGMFQAYSDLMEEQFDIVVVSVITAVPLDDHLRDLISNKAKKELGKDIVIHEHVQKDIIAGIILMAKGRIIDCSFLTMTERTKNILTSIHSFGE